MNDDDDDDDEDLWYWLYICKLILDPNDSYEYIKGIYNFEIKHHPPKMIQRLACELSLFGFS